jgi:DNA-binding transcriptional LysR family regulator
LPTKSIITRLSFAFSASLTIAERIARACATPRPLRLLKPPIEVPGFTVAMAWHARTGADGASQWLREQVARAETP